MSEGFIVTENLRIDNDSVSILQQAALRPAVLNTPPNVAPVFVFACVPQFVKSQSGNKCHMFSTKLGGGVGY